MGLGLPMIVLVAGGRVSKAIDATAAIPALAVVGEI